MKGRASAGVRCSPETVTLRFHDGTVDRQAHSCGFVVSNLPCMNLVNPSISPGISPVEWCTEDSHPF
jgi:hypothetical protein